MKIFYSFDLHKTGVNQYKKHEFLFAARYRRFYVNDGVNFVITKVVN